MSIGQSDGFSGVRLELVVLVYASWIASWALTVMPYQIDDAYIVYRYAENVLAHGTFSFNPAEANVEGVTSPLWLFLMIAISALSGGSAELYAPWFGLVIFMALAAMLWFVVSKKESKVVAAYVGILFLSIPSISFYSVTGMETILYSGLLLICALYFAGWWAEISGWMWILIPLLIFSRPEGVVVIPMIILGGMFVFNGGLKRTLSYVFVVILSLAGLYCGRFLLFGEWLPNTYYAKTPSISDGLNYFYQAVMGYPWFPVLMVVGFSGALYGKLRHRIMFMFALGLTVLPVLEGGDWMYLLRFFIPAMMMYAVAAGGLFTCPSVLKTRLFAVLCLLFVSGYGAVTMYTTQIYTDRLYSAGKIKRHAVHMWLSANDLKNVAAVDLGQLFYGTGYMVTDLAGLTDPYIARLPGGHLEKKVPYEYLSQRGVECIILRIARLPESDEKLGVSSFDNPAEWHIYEQLVDEYELIALFPDPSHTGRGITSYAVFAKAELKLNASPVPVKKSGRYDVVDYSAIY